MKIAVIVVRILMGLLFLFASVAYFFKLFPAQEVTGALKSFNEGVEASGYLMQVVKVIELLCALAFLTNRFVPLATVLLFPITLNIVLVHAFMAPEGLPMAIAILIGNLFLAFAYRKQYAPLMIVK